MKGYAIKNKERGIGFDCKENFLKNFLKCLPSNDPVFTIFLPPDKTNKITIKENESVMPTLNS